MRKKFFGCLILLVVLLVGGVLVGGWTGMATAQETDPPMKVGGDVTYTGVHTFANVVNGGSDVVAVTFPEAFASPPVVVCSFAFEGHWPSLAGGPAHCWASKVTSSGFWLRMYQYIGLSASFRVNWVAVGPE